MTVEWKWWPADAYAMAVRSDLEYGDDEGAMAAIDPDTEEVYLHRETEVEHSVVTARSAHYVTFRGTEPSVLADWVEDARVIRRDYRDEDGVHSGFLGAVEGVADEVFDRVSDGRPVYVTGHSKGAANATVLALMSLDRRDVNLIGGMTFGSPRVLADSVSERFSEHLGWAWWRVVNNNDVVTRVPFSSHVRRRGGYWHVGRLAYLDHRGVVNLDSTGWERFKDRVAGRVASLRGGEPVVEEVQGLSREGLRRLEEVGVETLSQVTAKSQDQLISLLGYPDAERVAMWAMLRRSGGGTLGPFSDVSDGTADHAMSRYVNILRVAAGSRMSRGRPEISLPWDAGSRPSSP